MTIEIQECEKRRVQWEKSNHTSGWNWTPQIGLVLCLSAIIFSTPWLEPQAKTSNSLGKPSSATTRLLNWIAPKRLGILLNNELLDSCLILVNCPWIGAGALMTCEFHWMWAFRKQRNYSSKGVTHITTESSS